MRFVILVAAVVTFAIPHAWSAPANGRVVSWTDGDTLRVALASGSIRVRLIGIDAPEISRGDRAARQGEQLGKDVATIVRLGRQAKAAAERLAPPGTPVRVETDVQTHDRFGRLLAYVFLPDGQMVNEELVQRGWAMVLTIPPNVRYAERFVRAQQNARRHRRGLWSGSAPRRVAASQTINMRIPLGIVVGSVVSGTTATIGLLAAHTTWRAAWFVPAFWRSMQALSSLLFGALPLLAAAAVHSGRTGTALLLVLWSAAALLIRWRPIVGLLGAFAVLAGPWASVWPIPVMLGDFGAFVDSAAVDPTNLPFLLFVGATLAALGRIGFVRRRLGQPFP